MDKKLISGSSGLFLLGLIVLLGIFFLNSTPQTPTTFQSPIPTTIAGRDALACRTASDSGFTFNLYGYVDHGHDISVLWYGLRNENKKDVSYVAFGIADSWNSIGPFWYPYPGELGNYGQEWTNTKGRPGFRSLKFETQFDGFSNGVEDYFGVPVIDFDVTQPIQLQAKAGNQTTTVTVDFNDPECLRSAREMPDGFERAIAAFISPLPTPTVMVCAEPEEWLTYSDPVVGITLHYPPDAKFSATPRYDLPPERRTGAIFGAGISIRPACKGYNSSCYETMGIRLSVYENLDNLAVEDYVLNIYAADLNLTDAELYKYGEIVTIDGHKGIRFEVPHDSPDWVRRITGHPEAAQTPVTFIEHSSKIILIKMIAPIDSPFDYPLYIPCEQAIQSYDEIVNKIRFE